MQREFPFSAPRAGGVIENIQDSVNGFLYQPGARDDFIDKLKILVDNSQLRQAMGISGRQSIIGKYSWDNTVQNLVDIWSKNKSSLRNKFFLLLILYTSKYLDYFYRYRKHIPNQLTLRRKPREG